MHGTPPATQSPGDQNLHHGTVLAFDFGERRMGVAIGDLALRIAHPLETIDCAMRDQRFERIAALVSQWNPVGFVVGLPLNVDGSEHSLAPAVRAFADELRRRFGIVATLVDERFTSAQAVDSLREAGVRGKAQKQYLDQVAASSILEDFFAHDDSAA